MEKYSMEEIKLSWSEYKRLKMLKLMRMGKVEYRVMNGKGMPSLDGYTSAKTVPVSSVLSFPKFLERRNADG